jgi:hypothetical protein
MIVKEVHLGDSGQDKLRAGIKKIAGAVKSTLGARGRTVLIESENHVGGITVTKDGVTVAKSINLYDPTENLAVVMMRQSTCRGHHRCRRAVHRRRYECHGGYQGDQRDHPAYRCTPQEEEQEGERTQAEGCRNHICQQ